MLTTRRVLILFSFSFQLSSSFPFNPPSFNPFASHSPALKFASAEFAAAKFVLIECA